MQCDMTSNSRLMKWHFGYFQDILKLPQVSMCMQRLDSSFYAIGFINYFKFIASSYLTGPILDPKQYRFLVGNIKVRL